MRQTTILFALCVFCSLAAGLSAQERDTVLDTVYDTVIVHDTVLLPSADADVTINGTGGSDDFDAPHLIEKYLSERDKEVEFRMTVAAILLAIVGLVVAVLTYVSQRQGDRLAKEARNARLDLDKAVDDMRAQVKEEIAEVRDRRKRIDKVYDEIVAKKKATDATIAEMDERVASLVEKATAGLGGVEKESITERLRLIEEGDAEDAVDNYERLLLDLRLSGKSEDILPSSLHRNVGLSYSRLERWDKAIAALQSYLKDVPNDSYALFACGYAMDELYDATKDKQWLERAVEKYQRATEIKPDYHEVFYNWGISLDRMFDATKDKQWLERAFDKYQKATQIKPDKHEAFYNWGISLNNMYDATEDKQWLEEASMKYQKATEIKPDDHEAYDNWSGVLINTYHATGEEHWLEEALEKASHALSLAPLEKNHYYNIACAHALLGNKSEMLAALKEAIEYDGKFKKMAHEDKDKDFERYWDDRGFIALTKEDDGKKGEGGEKPEG